MRLFVIHKGAKELKVSSDVEGQMRNSDWTGEIDVKEIIVMRMVW